VPARSRSNDGRMMKFGQSVHRELSLLVSNSRRVGPPVLHDIEFQRESRRHIDRIWAAMAAWQLSDDRAERAGC